MHEYSLAQSLVQTAIEVAMENNANKILKINLKFGKFALVMEDQFRFCLDIIKEENVLTKEMQVNISWEDGIIQCDACKFNGTAETNLENTGGMITSLCCPKCKSYETRIIKGMETYIQDISIDTN